MSKEIKKQKEDIDYSNIAVPKDARKNRATMFMIMFGFTLFAASLWVGKELAEGLDFWGFIISIVAGGILLSVYTGLLGYIGAETGLSLDLLSMKTFGRLGSYLPSAIISFTQIGWFGVGIAMFCIPVEKELFGGGELAQYAFLIVIGVCTSISAYFGIKTLTIISYVAVPLVAVLGTVAVVIAIKNGDKTLIDQFEKSNAELSILGGISVVIGSFVSGGTTTPNFMRFAKNGRAGFWVAAIAFFVGNSIMYIIGGITYAYVGGNDVFNVMANLGLFYSSVIVLGINIWTYNNDALYSAGFGLANIFEKDKKETVFLSGIIGTFFAIWIYNNFLDWLTILSCTIPPVGIIMIISYFRNRKKYENTDSFEKVNWFAVAGAFVGGIVANIVPWGITSINGMAVASAIYLGGEWYMKRKRG